MDADDPEERITDLERQQVESVAAGEDHTVQQPPYISGKRQATGPRWSRAQGFGASSGIESQPSHAAPRPKRRRLKSWELLLVAISGAASLYLFGLGAHDVYGYRVGTPTTARVIDCTVHNRSKSFIRKWEHCVGKWNVGGESHTGKIHGDRYGYQVGSSVDVRVRGDEAFTSTGAKWPLIGGTVMAGLSVAYVWIRRREKDGARAAPTIRAPNDSLPNRSTSMPAGAPEFMANAALGGLTASAVRSVAFSKPPLGRRGYNQDEVDAFLDRVQTRLLNPSIGYPTAADVHNFAFSKPPSGNRGYNQDEVDAYLVRVEAEIRRLDGTR
ncbi:DivIVA domain-containing protein [Mycobacterium sp. UM_CSW]|uniref:DivIVA domain-containing protein n=1 Tax=Mycobacterium sp. UM_CSW TaxID=1370119 RepID=UPI00040E4FAB|nr:DivIVA domain-containing protein [Mycobacterium sp. UM_CSW]